MRVLEVAYGRGLFVRHISTTDFDVVRHVQTAPKSRVYETVLIARIHRDVLDGLKDNAYVIQGMDTMRFSQLNHAVDRLVSLKGKMNTTETVNADNPVVRTFTTDQVENKYQTMTRNARKRAERAAKLAAEQNAQTEQDNVSNILNLTDYGMTAG